MRSCEAGKRTERRRLSVDCRLLLNAEEVIDVNTMEEPNRMVVVDALAWHRW